MLTVTLSAFVLVAATVGVHATGLGLLLLALRRLRVQPPTGLWPISRMLIFTAGWLILVHLAAICVWGLFYLGWGCLPDAESAFYFAGASYTTVGCGDLVLAKPWRMLGPVESLLGMLMCGLSTGFFFAVVSHIYQSAKLKTADSQQ
jgi:hypothetical protein